MAMEGINWEEVNSQGNEIVKKYNSLGIWVNKEFQDFVDELKFYWASGNAIAFGDWVQEDADNFMNFVESSRVKVADYINHAGAVYASTFNVPNQINVQVGAVISGLHAITNPFSETKYGVTGMNKSAVDDCYEKLKTNVENLIEEYKSYFDGIHLSIFDVASAQETAFKDALDKLYASCRGLVDKALHTINVYKNEEEDRITFAKQQTVSTFNA